MMEGCWCKLIFLASIFGDFFQCSVSSIFGDDSEKFVNLSVLLNSSYALFRRRKMRYRTIYVHFRGQTNPLFGDDSEKFVNLHVLLNSSYALFRRRKTWYRTIYVHFRGQTNFRNLGFLFGVALTKETTKLIMI